MAIKKSESCSNPLLKKKIRQSKCYTLQCGSLHDPYTASCKFSTVRSSAAGHLVLCYSRVASLLLSLHPGLEPGSLECRLDFWKEKEVTWSRSGESCGCSNIGMFVLFQMPTHCTITRFGFHARQINGIKCGLFSNHAPLGQTTLCVGRVFVVY